MTTPDRYKARLRPGSSPPPIKSLADFLDAASQGFDLWGDRYQPITWSTMDSDADHAALKALGWDASADFGPYGMDTMFVYKPGA